MPFSLKTHTESVRNNRVVVTETPYIRLNQGDGPPVFLQSGKAYTEAGDELETLPVWFEEEFNKLTPEAKASVGYGEAKATPAPAPAPKKASTKKASAKKSTAKTSFAGSNFDQDQVDESIQKDGDEDLSFLDE